MTATVKFSGQTRCGDVTVRPIRRWAKDRCRPPRHPGRPLAEIEVDFFRAVHKLIKGRREWDAEAFKEARESLEAAIWFYLSEEEFNHPAMLSTSVGIDHAARTRDWALFSRWAREATRTARELRDGTFDDGSESFPASS